MTDKIIETVDRTPPDLVSFFAEQTAADIHEAMNKRNAMAADINHVAGPPALAGSAVTARLTPGDNTMVHVAANVAEPGDVLVFESQSTATATWGELATRNAQRKNLGGVVSGGNVRDVAAIDELGFPVFARAVSHEGARKEGTGSVNVPVTVGGVVVNPGDVIVGDRDGVTVIPRSEAAAVKTATEQKRAAEDSLRDRISNGESLYEAADLENVLEESDIERLDRPSE